SACVALIFFLLIRPPLRSTLFPYTTLFRSRIAKPNWLRAQAGVPCCEKCRIASAKIHEAMYPTGDATNGDLRASGRSFYSGVGVSCERCERVFTRLGAPRGRNPQLCCKLLKRQQHRWLGQANILGWFGIGLGSHWQHIHRVHDEWQGGW